MIFLIKLRNILDERLPDITIFEGAATSDPIPVEPYTHSLEKAIDSLGITKMLDLDL